MAPRIDRIQCMMRAYEGPRHMVVCATVQNGDAQFIHLSQEIAGIECADVIFEIGSITKVFTAILLCVLAEEGSVDPRAPLRNMAPDLVDVPDQITPERLISHTSGLPNIHMPLWKALMNPSPEGPYAGFSRADLLGWLHDRRGKTLRAKRRHAYSNVGVGLLGEAMAMREGKPFVDLLAEKVIAPLGLTDTTDGLTDAQHTRFAQPRDTAGRPVNPWTFEALAAAGCLRSTARDLARFSGRVLQALNAPETALDRAIQRSVEPILGLGRRGSTETAAQCAGWMSVKPGKTDRTLLYCNGGTAGSTCALYICPKAETACAILSNNGVAANLWASAKLGWSNQPRQMSGFLGAA
jgi:CubicO group peptidase (beta-lactamase class C family)